MIKLTRNAKKVEYSATGQFLGRLLDPLVVSEEVFLIELHVVDVAVEYGDLATQL